MPVSRAQAGRRPPPPPGLLPGFQAAASPARADTPGLPRARTGARTGVPGRPRYPRLYSRRTMRGGCGLSGHQRCTSSAHPAPCVLDVQGPPCHWATPEPARPGQLRGWRLVRDPGTRGVCGRCSARGAVGAARGPPRNKHTLSRRRPRLAYMDAADAHIPSVSLVAVHLLPEQPSCRVTSDTGTSVRSPWRRRFCIGRKEFKNPCCWPDARSGLGLDKSTREPKLTCPSYTIADCRVPQIEDAEIRNKTYRRGDMLTVACHEGFRIRYPDPYNMVSLCRDDGTWDNLPLCQGCLRPLASSNGYMNVSDLQTSFPVGTVISYHCFPGFKLEGAESLECLHSLLWSSSPPRCLALEVCPLPPTVSHGDFICHPRPCERYSHGTVLEFYCDPGYSLTSDYKYITCQYGEWFPSYQVYCIKSEQTWPSPHETLLTTWKIVAFTATSVLLVLLLVILARMFQTKFKTHFPTRGPPRSSSSDPDFVVVDGVPVMLPSYDEAVSGGLGALGPGYLAAVGRGCPLPVNDQSPPAYPGSGDTDMGPGASEPCDSGSGPSELLQSPYPPSEGHGGPRPGCVDTGAGSVGEAASTSPGIDIADEIPLMEDDP
nr:sushi domain-containing protein 4 [Vulpes vulpes]